MYIRLLYKNYDEEALQDHCIIGHSFGNGGIESEGTGKILKNKHLRQAFTEWRYNRRMAVKEKRQMEKGPYPLL